MKQIILSKKLNCFYEKVKGNNEEGLFPTKWNYVFITQWNGCDYVEFISIVIYEKIWFKSKPYHWLGRIE